MRDVRVIDFGVEQCLVGMRRWSRSQVLALVFGGLVLWFLAAVVTPGPAGAQKAGVDWEQVGADIDGAAAGDESGHAVAVSADGTRLVIGSPDSDTNGDDPGHVRVFDSVNGEWVQVGADIDGAAGGDRFGDAVAVSAAGSTVVVGAPLNDTIGESVGQVRVFNLVDGEWAQLGIVLFGEALFDQFGGSVAVSADGTQVVAGAVLHDDRAGHVRVFELDPAANSWLQVGADIDGAAAGDESGGSVAVSADGARLVIGASGNDDNGDASGHVRVFDLVNGEWVQVGTDLDGEVVEDEFGGSVAVSADGTTVAASALFNGGNADFNGYVRVFELDARGSWAQVGADIEGEAAFDLFGGSLAVTADGSTVVAGADLNDGSGEDSGHVRVFDLVDGEWMQVGADIDGEAAGDGSGVAVAVSADGARVVAGAAGNDGNGDDAGHVRVYDRTDIVEPGQTCATLEVTVNLANDEEPTDGADVILGTAGDDVIDGLGGNDTICGLGGNDTIDGGDGEDRIVGAAGDDMINGGAGRDQIFAGAGDDTVNGGTGNDRINGGDGIDTINGENGNDRIFGGGGNDVLNGNGGFDRVAGGDGGDLINGGTHDDELLGNLGLDRLNGDGGDDVLRGGLARDTFDGGAGSNDGCTLTDPNGLVETRINCETGVFGR